MPSALSLFHCSSESSSCRSSLMFAGKLGGVPVVRSVKGHGLVPSRSFNLVLAAMYGFGTNGRHTLSPGRGISRYLSDQGCLFLLLRLDRARASEAGQSAGDAER